MPKYRRGAGSIYKRGKVWWVSYYVGNRNICESAKTKDQGEARDFLKRRLGQVASGEPVSHLAGKVLLADLAEEHVAALRQKSLGPEDEESTTKLKAASVAVYRLLETCGRVRAQDLGISEIADYIAFRRAHGEKNRTINSDLTVLAEIYELGIRSKRITVRPQVALLPDDSRARFEDLPQLLFRDYEINERKSLYSVRIKVRHLERFLAGKLAEEIEASDIDLFVDSRRKEGASNAEINRELALLRRMFSIGLEKGRVNRRPPIKMLSEGNVRKGFFEPWEFDKLLAELPDFLRPPVTFAYWTGWRMHSEVLSLTWAHVDLDEGKVTLEGRATKNGEPRTIYLPPELGAVIEKEWKDHLSTYPDCPFVFHRKGAAIRSIRWAWMKACERAGLTGKIPHDFRRTAIRNMVRAGIGDTVAMDLSGHRTRDVFDRYNITSDRDRKEAARRLGESLGSRTTTLSTTIDGSGPTEGVVRESEETLTH